MKPLKKWGKKSILDILHFGKYILRYLLFESRRTVFRGSQTCTHTPQSDIPKSHPQRFCILKELQVILLGPFKSLGLTVSFGLTVCVLSSFP